MSCLLVYPGGGAMGRGGNGAGCQRRTDYPPGRLQEPAAEYVCICLCVRESPES